jgi:hypothetical protein
MSTEETYRLEGVKPGFKGGEVTAVGIKSGERLSLALQPADVYDTSEIPEFLQSYKDPQYRAGEMSPVLLSDRESDKYRTFNENNAFQPVVVKTSGQAAVAEVDPESALSTFTVDYRACGSFIPKQTEMQAAYDVKTRAARRCRNAIDMDIEIDVMNQLGTSTNWDAAVRTAAATAWDQAGSTPIVDTQTAVRKSFQQPRAIWMTEQTAHAFINHDDTKDYMRQMLGDTAVGGALRDLDRAMEESIDFKIPGIPMIRVVASKYLNTAGTLVYTLGKVAVLICGPNNPTPDDIMSAATYRWRGPSGTGFEAREYTVEGRGPWGGTMLVLAEASDHVIVANKAGGIITNTAT